MKVLLFTSHYLPGYKGGGPIKTIFNLISETSNIIKYSVVTSDRDLGDCEPYSCVKLNAWNEKDNTSIFYSGKGLRSLTNLIRIVYRTDYDVIYFNSFFSLLYSFIPLIFAKSMKKPILLGPRGEFSEGALNIKASKKKLFIRFFKLLKLDRGVFFQASSQFELLDIKKTLGENVNVLIAEDIGSQTYAERLFEKDKDVLKLVFISRISPKKNLDYAVKLLANVKCKVIFDIYGPIEDQIYWQECSAIIENLPEHIVVSHKDAINPNKVVNILSTYDLFFMPTKGENYGHVIAEALCAGLPILIADTTPWRQLVDEGIGWDISLNDPHKFVAAIEEAAAMSSGDYQAYRSNVLDWAKYKFSQKKPISDSLDMFRSVVKK